MFIYDPVMSNLPGTRYGHGQIGRLRDFVVEEGGSFPEHERPAAAGSPATPDHPHVVRWAYGAIAVLVGTTAGLGGALVSVNLNQFQALPGLRGDQVAWLSTAYLMTNVSANLLLIKFRQQYGLRCFALLALGSYAALSLGHLLMPDLRSTLALRAASGFAAAALIPLCLFYMMQAFPARWRLRALVLGIGVTQCAIPLARVLSPSLLAAGGWRSLFLLESGLALLSLAAVGLLRLPPAERLRVFKPLDMPIFLLMGGGLALIAAVLGLGRWAGWYHAPWIVLSSVVALTALLGGAAIEGWRQTPLLNLGWLGRGDILRFAVAVFMARIVLAEQNVAVEVVTMLGGGADRLAALSLVMFAGAVGGAVSSAATVNAEKIARPMMLAIGIVAVAAFAESAPAEIGDLPRFYLTQSAIAFAGTFFLGPALLFGITNALRHGSRELISFIVLFGVVNGLGALAGPALLQTAADLAEAAHGSPFRARFDTLRLVAILAAGTTLYLAMLIAMRMRRRLRELRTEAAVVPATPSMARSGWRPPRVGPTAMVLLSATALAGVSLIVAAF